LPLSFSSASLSLAVMGRALVAVSVAALAVAAWVMLAPAPGLETWFGFIFRSRSHWS
jgi:hypothetical protein